MNKLRNGIIGFVDFFYFPFLRRYISCQMFRYGFCGVANLFLNIFLYYITFHYVLSEENLDLGFVTISAHIAAFLIVFPITFFTGFWLARNISFQSSPLRGHTQMFRYLLTTCAGLLFNYLGMKLLVDKCGIYPTPSVAILAVVITLFSFFMNRRFSFHGCQPEVVKTSKKQQE